MDAVPDQMSAIAVRGGKGPADALVAITIAVPKPSPEQILIHVRAAGVNRPDILQRKGLYAPPPGASETLGLEVAGQVVAVGASAPRWRVGDEVCALLGGGGYAEYCVVDARQALPIPRGLGLHQAAGLPETVFTVFANVLERGRLQAGETFLVHGATSGIGVMAIQMAKAAGARVIATGRGLEKAQAAGGFGADICIDSTAADFVEVVGAEGGADMVLDMVGGDFAQKNLDVLKPEGRLVQIAFQAGARVELNLARVLTHRLTLTGSTLRSRSADEKARLAREVEATVWPWIEAGRVSSILDRSFALRDAAAAHAYLEAGGHVGKILLIP